MMDVVVLIIIGIIYFLPSIVANSRNHRAQLGIFVMTLFLGWSGLGWILALIWACNSNVERVNWD
jgi:hypothetical protein